MPAAFREFIVLPVGGSPYVVDVFKTDDMNALPVLQREVAGYIEEFNPKNFVIHPSFCQSDAKWALAERLRKLPKTMAYVNEDGGRKCSINCGTVIKDPRMRLGGCPHLFGNVVLAVYQSALAKAGISTAELVKDENFTCHECAEPSTKECDGCGEWFCDDCVSKCAECGVACEDCDDVCDCQNKTG